MVKTVPRSASMEAGLVDEEMAGWTCIAPWLASEETAQVMKGGGGGGSNPRKRQKSRVVKDG